MTISAFLIRLIFLALPGIVSYMLFRKLSERAKREKWEHLAQVILFSVIIYVVYGVFVWISGLFGYGHKELSFFKAVLDEKCSIVWGEVIIASLIGVPVAFVASYFYTHKFINNIGRVLRVTNSFGDEDVWDFFHNASDKPEYQWVFVRDHKTNLLFFGYILAYSGSEKERELLIEDVDVYNNETGKFIYKTKRVYLCRNRYDLTIEIPEICKETESGKLNLSKEN